MLKKNTILISCLALQACSIGASYFYNAKVPSGQMQVFYDQDSQYCRDYAIGRVPYPINIITPSVSYRTYGVTSITPTQNAIYINEKYTTRGYISPSDGMAAGLANITTALITSANRQEPYNDCMARLGWESTPSATPPPVKKTPSKPLKTKYTPSSLREKYDTQSNNKAFVIADNNNTSASWGNKTIKIAKSRAIKACKDKGWTNCKVINVNGTRIY